MCCYRRVLRAQCRLCAWATKCTKQVNVLDDNMSMYVPMTVIDCWEDLSLDKHYTGEDRNLRRKRYTCTSAHDGSESNIINNLFHTRKIAKPFLLTYILKLMMIYYRDHATNLCYSQNKKNIFKFKKIVWYKSSVYTLIINFLAFVNSHGSGSSKFTIRTIKEQSCFTT